MDFSLPGSLIHGTFQARVLEWVDISFSSLVVSNSLWPHGLQPVRLLCPWDFPGKNPGVGCDSLLQGVFPTHGSNSHLCIAGRFFTIWAIREAHNSYLKCVVITITKWYLYLKYINMGASLVTQSVKNLPAMQRCRFNPWVGKISWRRSWQSTPVFCVENPMDWGAWQVTVHMAAKS